MSSGMGDSTAEIRNAARSLMREIRIESRKLAQPGATQPDRMADLFLPLICREAQKWSHPGARRMFFATMEGELRHEPPTVGDAQEAFLRRLADLVSGEGSRG